ncbi:GGDEF domain-containing protein [Maricaulis sp. CAU 1757]
MLDTRSLVVALVLVMLIGIVLHFVNWRIHPSSRGARSWTVALGFKTFGLSLSAFFAPDHAGLGLWILFITNTAISTAYVLLLSGTAHFAERHFPRWVYAVLVASYVLTYAWFIFVDPQVAGRVIMIALVISVTSILSITRLPAIARRDGLPGVAVLLGAHVAAGLYATVLAIAFMLGGSAVNNVYDDSQLIPLAVLGLIAVEASTIFGYLLLTSAYTQARLNELARTDPLTELPNRRAFEEVLQTRLMQRHPEAGQVQLAIFDIDHFKRVNDVYGHETGDDVLRQIARLCRQSLGEADFLARIGGEEFGVIAAPGTDRDGMWALAERLRRTVETGSAQVQGTRLSVTISIGCAQSSAEDSIERDPLYSRADSALYSAKAEGRNRTVYA